VTAAGSLRPRRRPHRADPPRRESGGANRHHASRDSLVILRSMHRKAHRNPWRGHPGRRAPLHLTESARDSTTSAVGRPGGGQRRSPSGARAERPSHSPRDGCRDQPAHHDCRATASRTRQKGRRTGPVPYPRLRIIRAAALDRSCPPRARLKARLATISPGSPCLLACVDRAAKRRFVGGGIGYELNLVGCSTGSTLGLAPLRIGFTVPAARRKRSSKSAELPDQASGADYKAFS